MERCPEHCGGQEDSRWVCTEGAVDTTGGGGAVTTVVRGTGFGRSSGRTTSRGYASYRTATGGAIFGRSSGMSFIIQVGSFRP
jgi:hypothetical protein